MTFQEKFEYLHKDDSTVVLRFFHDYKSYVKEYGNIHPNLFTDEEQELKCIKENKFWELEWRSPYGLYHLHKISSDLEYLISYAFEMKVEFSLMNLKPQSSSLRFKKYMLNLYLPTYRQIVDN